MKSRMWHVTMIEPQLSKDWNNYWRLIRSVSIGKIDGIFSMVLRKRLTDQNASQKSNDFEGREGSWESAESHSAILTYLQTDRGTTNRPEL